MRIPPHRSLQHVCIALAVLLLALVFLDAHPSPLRAQAPNEPTPAASPQIAEGNASQPAAAAAGSDIRLQSPRREISHGRTNFVWRWDQPLPEGMGFEVRVWKPGEPPLGIHNSVLDNQNGRIQKLSDNIYRLNIDISRAAGVRLRSGGYLWTVYLVQISPTYAETGIQALPAPMLLQLPGDSVPVDFSFYTPAPGEPTVRPTSRPTREPEEEGPPDPAETETREPAETETREPAETETQEPAETETQEPAETETQEPVETETQEPVETETPCGTYGCATVLRRVPPPGKLGMTAGWLGMGMALGVVLLGGGRKRR